MTLLSKPKAAPTAEDNDFMTAFDKMMAETIQVKHISLSLINDLFLFWPVFLVYCVSLYFT